MTPKVLLTCLVFIVATILVHCKPQMIVDGMGEVSTKDPEVVSLAKKSFAQFKTNHKGNYKFGKIKLAKRQDIGNRLYHIEYIVANGKKEECVSDNLVFEPWSNNTKHNIGKCQ